MADPSVHQLFSYGTLHMPEVQLSQFGRLPDGTLAAGARRSGLVNVRIADHSEVVHKGAVVGLGSRRDCRQLFPEGSG